MKKVNGEWIETDEKEWWIMIIKYIEVITVFNQYKYTDKEIEEIIKSMAILIDTREKKNGSYYTIF